MINFEINTDSENVRKYRNMAKSNIIIENPRVLASYEIMAKILSFENPHSDKPIFEILTKKGNAMKLRAKDVYIFNPVKGQIYSFQITTFIYKEKQIIQLITNIKN